uniref:Proteasome (prosome, macropain) assembly chaperone 3 n=3 Tax=Takifugu TaxID=31032 RepID=A0A674P7A4_TAKRU
MTFFSKDMKHLNVTSESYVPATLNIISFLHSTCKMSSLDTVIKSRQKENEINGILTQVVCTEFSNYIFVVLTQYGKIGSLISITPDSRSTDISTPTFSTKVLLGKDEPLTHVCAKNLATFVSQEASNRPVLLGLALKDSSIDAIKQMKELIRSCQVW